MIFKLSMPNAQLTRVGVKLPLISLCCLIIFLPSVYWQGLANPIDSSKFVFFYNALLTAVTLIFISHLFFTAGEWRIHITSADLVLSFLMTYIILNRYIVQYDFGFSQKFFQLIGLFILYLVLRRFQVNEYIYLLLAVLLGGFLQAVNGMLQLAVFAPSNSVFVITGNFANPGSYAGYLAVSGVLALGTYLFSDQLMKLGPKSLQFLLPGSREVNVSFVYCISLLCLVSVLIVLPALRSRAAWIGFATGACFLLTLKYNWFQVAARKLRSITVRFLVLVVLTLMIAAGAAKIYQYKKASANGRLLIYKVTSEIVKDHPAMGVGYDRFKAEYMNAQANWFAGKKLTAESVLADNSYYAFNEPLQFTVENGLIGLLLISLTTLIFVKIKVDNQYRILKRLCLGTLAAILMFGFFTYFSDNLPLTMVAIIALALMANIDTAPNFLRIGPVNIPLNGNAASKGIILILIGGFIWNGVQFTQGIKGDYKSWGAAEEAYNREDYITSVNLFRSVQYLLHDDGDYLMQYGKAMAMAGSYAEAIGILNSAKLHLNNTVIEIALGDSYKALGRYRQAEHAYQKAADMVPGRFYPHYLLAKLYEKEGDNARALGKAREILSKEIKVPSTAITEMRNEMKMLVARNEQQLLADNSIDLLIK
jgi:O-antigen polymerase